MRVSWPDTGMNYWIEAAPTLDGPWLPVRNAALPGLQQMTLPVDASMRFFRVFQSP